MMMQQTDVAEELKQAVRDFLRIQDARERDARWHMNANKTFSHKDLRAARVRLEELMWGDDA